MSNHGIQRSFFCQGRGGKRQKKGVCHTSLQLSCFERFAKRLSNFVLLGTARRAPTFFFNLERRTLNIFLVNGLVALHLFLWYIVYPEGL